MKKASFIIFLLFWFLAITGVAVGYKVLRIPEDPVHFHANFAVVFDEIPFDFSTPSFMTIQPCGQQDHGAAHLKSVHLHDSIGNVVHVHASGITWQHLFDSLSFNLEDEKHKRNLEYMPQYFLNGIKTESSVYQSLIFPQDQLLVYVGSASASQRILENDLLIRATTAIGTDAADYDAGKKTASTCSPEGKRTIWERFKIAFQMNTH